MNEVWEQYNNDPQFKMMADTIFQLLQEARLTPFEVRQAATLACIKYEMERPTQITVDAVDWLEKARKP